MKILLVRYHNKANINTRLPASLNKAQGIYPPLGIAYIAAVLERHGYNVKVLDVQALNLTSEESRKVILNEKANVVGITTMTPTFKGALEAARFAKESGAIVVVGGPHVEIYPKEILSHDFIDYAIGGEAEYTMLELIRAIKNKKPIEKIRGLVFRKNKEVIVNSPTIIKNLNELPFPARHLLPMERYDCIITKRPVTTMITSRGCPFHCGFCFKQASDKLHRTRSAKNVVKEIEYCIKKYKVKEVMFYDDTFTIKRQHVTDICNGILKKGLKIEWEAPTRVDCIDLELLKLMKKAGCIRLRFGVESGDPRILNLMRKNPGISRIKKVFRWTNMAGIETFAYFIIGYYSDTPESIRNTIDLAKELNPDWAMFTIATPLPSTNLFDLCVKDKMINKDYWLKYTLGEKVGKLNYLVPDAEKWVERAYKEFYFRPKFIIKKLKGLNSIDTLKKYIRGARSILAMKK